MQLKLDNYDLSGNVIILTGGTDGKETVFFLSIESFVPIHTVHAYRIWFLINSKYLYFI